MDDLISRQAAIKNAHFPVIDDAGYEFFIAHTPIVYIIYVISLGTKNENAVT